MAEVRRRGDKRGGVSGPNARVPRFMETGVILDREETALLDQIAAQEGRSRSWMIREAVRRTWLHGRRRRASARPDAGPRSKMRRTQREDDEWRRRLEALEKRIAARQPKDVTPEEIEAEITHASEEVRQERLRAAGGR